MCECESLEGLRRKRELYDPGSVGDTLGGMCGLGRRRSTGREVSSGGLGKAWKAAECMSLERSLEVPWNVREEGRGRSKSRPPPFTTTPEFWSPRPGL